jgi:uncharacterized protein YggE
MKRVSLFFNILLAAAMLLMLLPMGLPTIQAQGATPSPTSQDAEPCDPSRSVQVTGAATINVVPDRALILLGVQSNGLTPELVQAANSLAIQKVIGALDAQGIEAKDIATDIYIIEPVYESYESLYIKGYRIYNTISVTLRDVSKTSDVLAAALNAGANQVQSVEFTLAICVNTASAHPGHDSCAKSTGAGAAGAEAGCVLSIHENSWSYYNGWWYYGRSQNVWTQNTVQNAAPGGDQAGAGGDEPISLGQIAITAEVSASFTLK